MHQICRRRIRFRVRYGSLTYGNTASLWRGRLRPSLDPRLALAADIVGLGAGHLAVACSGKLRLNQPHNKPGLKLDCYPNTNHGPAIIPSPALIHCLLGPDRSSIFTLNSRERGARFCAAVSATPALSPLGWRCPPLLAAAERGLAPRVPACNRLNLESEAVCVTAGFHVQDHVRRHPDADI